MTQMRLFVDGKLEYNDEGLRELFFGSVIREIYDHCSLELSTPFAWSNFSSLGIPDSVFDSSPDIGHFQLFLSRPPRDYADIWIGRDRVACDVQPEDWSSSISASEFLFLKSALDHFLFRYHLLVTAGGDWVFEGPQTWSRYDAPVDFAGSSFPDLPVVVFWAFQNPHELWSACSRQNAHIHGWDPEKLRRDHIRTGCPTIGLNSEWVFHKPRVPGLFCSDECMSPYNGVGLGLSVESPLMASFLTSLHRSRHRDFDLSFSQGVVQGLVFGLYLTCVGVTFTYVVC